LRVEGVDTHPLVDGRDDMHLNPAGGLIEEGAMPEGGQAEVSSKLPVHAHEQVQIERRGNAEGVVVRRLEHSRGLLLIGAEKEHVADAQRLTNRAQKISLFIAIEISDRRAEKENYVPAPGTFRR